MQYSGYRWNPRVRYAVCHTAESSFSNGAARYWSADRRPIPGNGEISNQRGNRVDCRAGRTETSALMTYGPATSLGPFNSCVQLAPPKYEQRKRSKGYARKSEKSKNAVRRSRTSRGKTPPMPWLWRDVPTGSTAAWRARETSRNRSPAQITQMSCFRGKIGRRSRRFEYPSPPWSITWDPRGHRTREMTISIND